MVSPLLLGVLRIYGYPSIETSAEANLLQFSVANALGIFAPVLTLVLFAIFRSVHSTYAMDADIVFTSVALLALVTHPANMVMTIVPRAVASLANFQRIQALLAENPLLDKRENISPREHALESQGSLAISLEKVTLHPPSSTSPIIEDVSLSMNEGSILMCSGPMGSGKSALALSILGEINPVQGTIAVSDKRIGFYSQPVWLPTASIREVICGGSSVFDREWYITVINACCLASDLESFVDKDMTWVGTGGVNLSGGQKSRIVRAVSGLDIYRAKLLIWFLKGACSRGLFSTSSSRLGRSF